MSPDYAVAREVADGRLLRLLPDCSCLELDVQLVFLEARYMPARVRAFIDFAAARFDGTALWDRVEQP